MFIERYCLVETQFLRHDQLQYQQETTWASLCDSIALSLCDDLETCVQCSWVSEGDPLVAAVHIISKDARAVAGVLMYYVVHQHGFPARVMTGGGGEFVNNLFRGVSVHEERPWHYLQRSVTV